MHKKINGSFCDLQICLNELMIKKNDIIKDILKGMNFGVIDKPIRYAFTAIGAIQTAMEVAM